MTCISLWAISPSRALRGVALLCFLTLYSAGGIHAGPLAQPQGAEFLHNPQLPYNAWVICIDASLSPREDQFRKLLLIAEDFVNRDVSYNDLVWLIQIQSGSEPAALFQMPAGNGSVRSKRKTAEAQLLAAKAYLIASIRDTVQVAGTTDLKSPLETSLGVLKGHARAKRRILIIGSDYLQDSGPGKVSIQPPAMLDGISGRGVEALLFVTYPKAGYLKGLRLSPAGLGQAVEENWPPYLKRIQISPVAVRVVDAVPITTAQMPSTR